MKQYKAKGIVLHTVKYGDSSMVAYVLTDLFGRQTYMVQGVRSRSGRGNKAALFQPMFVVEIEGIEIPGAQMHRIREVRNLLPLLSVPFDVRKNTIALFISETIYRLVRETGADAPLFDFLVNAVTALDAIEQGVANFHLWFLVRLSRLLGFFPGNEYLPGAWFDIREGLFTTLKPEAGLAMSPENAHILAVMMDIELDGLGSVPLNGALRGDFLGAMLDYFGYHLDAVRSIHSIAILRDVF